METTFEILEKWLKESGYELRVYPPGKCNEPGDAYGWIAYAVHKDYRDGTKGEEVEANTLQSALIMLAHKLAAPKGGD